jgi:dihydrolipoamide dehydrogenase
VQRRRRALDLAARPSEGALIATFLLSGLEDHTVSGSTPGTDAAATDLAVVGGGPGGYTAAIRAAQLGVETTLVERAAYGGTCLNDGCIPSKALLSTTSLIRRAREAESMGVYADPTVDAGELFEWTADVVDGMARSVRKLCLGNGVTLREGTASFLDEQTLSVDGDTLAFDQCVLATGSQPTVLPGFPFDDEDVLDAGAALELGDVPDALVVVGAGYIGIELSLVFATLGSDVTVLEAEDRPLLNYEHDLVRPVLDRLTEDLDVEFVFETAAREWTGDAVLADTVDGERSFPADRCLVAVGREPNSGEVGLAAAGVETDADGFVQTDERTRTTNPNVLAVGDLAGEPMLAHEAAHEATVAASVVANDGDRADRDGRATTATLDGTAIPTVVYSDPEIATVGLTEAAAESGGIDPTVGQVPFRSNGRALTLDDPTGFVRVVADGDGRLVGGQIVGPEASELIGEIGLAVETHATLADVAATVHAHPTLGEAVFEAAENARGQAIHSLNR